MINSPTGVNLGAPQVVDASALHGSTTPLIAAVFQSVAGQDLLEAWKKVHCRGIFHRDPIEMAKRAAVSDFISNIESTLNHVRSDTIARNTSARESARNTTDDT